MQVANIRDRRSLECISLTTTALIQEGDNAIIDVDGDLAAEVAPTTPLGVPEEVVEQCLPPIYASLTIFSFIGCLMRLGLIYLHDYDGAPVVAILYPQIMGCLIIGWCNANKEVLIDLYYPLYIGLSTGLCGSITTFSSWSLSVFGAFVDLGFTGRSGGYNLLAGIAVTIIIIGMSLVSVSFGEHVAKIINLQTVFGHSDDWKAPVFKLETVRFRIDRLKKRDGAVMVVAAALWIMLGLLGIFVQTGRGVVFAATFAPLGTLVRYRFAIFNVKYGHFPLGTFTVNMVGTALLAIFYVLSHAPFTSTTSAECAILTGLSDGFCGCLTTISTFAVELRTLKLSSAYIYGIASTVLGQVIMLAIIGSVRFVGELNRGCVE
ncbi:hypothetical protein SeMB42_g04816 [Synchytrium endobioticum]|uniref:Fluoride ion transporter CrcB n=1 Tax=Synchytrium endobioticum TaxID=286115 RepID=A0A507DE61_9FUNG|nr:hypothetical protein SeMB42_g04816 [Synchytrium endobioticum]TPX49863.1 hypothetical protein SeLEV6574_g01240 [Synchytrium endobioticum]